MPEPVLAARVQPVATLTVDDRRTMFGVMEAHYDCLAWDRFSADLDAKDSVILLLADGRIVGFSTLKEVLLRPRDGGRGHRAVFSGDTVLERAYWGQKTLPRAFFGHLLRLKLRRPFQPLWWLLISKGYKTYLLMTNNFHTHWPRYERPTPAVPQRVMHLAYDTLFGDAYHPERGVVGFERSLGQLKPGVADASDALASQHPRVAFFRERNPNWARGEELACVARFTLVNTALFWARAWWRRLARRSKSAPRSTA